MKKYELKQETGEEGKVLYRVIALKDFSNVKAGEKGGLVESERNLSQTGNCWIDSKSLILGDSLVTDNAVVKNTTAKNNIFIGGNSNVMNSVLIGRVSIFDSASVNDCKIEGNVRIFEKAFIIGARIYDYVTIRGKAHIQDVDGKYPVIKDCALIADDAEIYGSVKVSGYAKVYEKAKLYENCVITDCAKIHGLAKINGVVNVSENADISGKTCLTGCSEIFGNAKISGNAYIKGSACIAGYGIVEDDGGYMNLHAPFWNKNFTIHKSVNGFWISGELFHGSYDSFLKNFSYTDSLDDFINLCNAFIKSFNNQ